MKAPGGSRLAAVRRTLASAIILAGLAVPALAQSIFFSKTFPGSVPPYFEVTLDRAGRMEYREQPGEDPLLVELPPADVKRIFEAVKALQYFRVPLASKRKVAFTGEKVLRYTSDTGETAEQSFSYTESPEAKQVVQWFERVAQTERHLIELERVVRFDRLGINDVLMQIESSLNDGRLIAPQQFVEILQKIAGNKRFLHIAQARAASLLERIEAKAPTQ